MASSRLTLFAWLRQLLMLGRTCCALMAILLFATADNTVVAQVSEEPFDDGVFAETYEESKIGENCNVCTPEAAEFDQWETLVDDDYRMHWDSPDLQSADRKPFDWVRHVGFRHSSTHGRHVGRGIPLEGTSLRNRPYHVDWFLGPLLGDSLIDGRVRQENVLIGGVRIGWDFDYFWGIEWRYGRADPNAQYATPRPTPTDVSYSISDVSLIYYPWGDSKVRPYGLLGIGAAQIDFLDDAGFGHDATLATMPFGFGVQFYQFPWLLWRLDVIDNMSFGDDNLSTMHNVSITAGMELRMGARPGSYWPWRPSRRFW